jgi:hypothetical protein
MSVGPGCPVEDEEFVRRERRYMSCAAASRPLRPRKWSTLQKSGGKRRCPWEDHVAGGSESGEAQDKATIYAVSPIEGG